MSKIEYIVKNGNPDCAYPHVELTHKQAKSIEMVCNRYGTKDIGDEIIVVKRRAEGIIHELYDICGIKILPPRKQHFKKQLVWWAIEHRLVRLDGEVYHLTDE